MFDTCVNALAKHGRLIVIGWISGYETDKGFNVSRTLGSLPQRLLPKSASVRGFFLFGYPKDIKVGNNNVYCCCFWTSTITYTCYPLNAQEGTTPDMNLDYTIDIFRSHRLIADIVCKIPMKHLFTLASYLLVFNI